MAVKSNAVGPGTVAQAAASPSPLLGGADENYYAEIYNPLSQDFIGRVASTRPVKAELTIVTNQNTPTLTQTEEDIRRNYGLTLINKDHPGRQHIVQTVTIAAGQTLRLQGNEAQVIIRQLVDIIMDQREQSLFKGDPTARRAIEDEIVLNIGSMDEFLTKRDTSARELLNKPEDTYEQAFPSEQARPQRGRSAKRAEEDSRPNPAPGTGSNYVPARA